eukprot:2236620-Pleurochrysis_carterae.AAC.1
MHAAFALTRIKRANRTAVACLYGIVESQQRRNHFARCWRWLKKRPGPIAFTGGGATCPHYENGGHVKEEAAWRWDQVKVSSTFKTT